MHRTLAALLLTSAALTSQSCARTPAALRPIDDAPIDWRAEPGEDAPPGDPARASWRLGRAAAAQDALALARARFGPAWSGPLPAQPPWQEILNAYEQPSGPLSRGSTSNGALLEAVELPLRGPHHIIVDRARPRDTRYATPTMLAAILDSAAAVAQAHPGSLLSVGNISTRDGGRIRWSVSHNSGRDADLAFYSVNATTGEPVVTPDLVAFDDRGHALGPHDLRFDVARNWALARALLTHPRAQIQYLFISEGLKAMLLNHAAQLGEPDALVARAAQVLHQPTDSSPHNDHFHLRITCDREDRLLGCLDIGPRWDWVDWHDDALLARVEAMRPALREQPERARAYLEQLRAPYGPDALLEAAAQTEDVALQAKLIDSAASAWTWSGAAIARTISLATQPELDARARVQLHNLLRRSVDPQVIGFARARLVDPQTTEQERVWAAEALSHHMDPALVPFILETLPEQPPQARVALSRVLHRITNRDEAVDWARASPDRLRLALERWQRWWQQHRELPREVWVRDGFASLGVNPELLPTAYAVEPLLDRLPGAPDHVVYNINLTLRQITGRWSSLEQRDAMKLKQAWEAWWRKNRARLLAAG